MFPAPPLPSLVNQIFRLELSKNRRTIFSFGFGAVAAFVENSSNNLHAISALLEDLHLPFFTVLE